MAGKNNKWHVVSLLMVLVVLEISQATHFRGGTISWKPLGGRTVQFFFKLGYLYGYGNGCQAGLEGQYVTRANNNDYWECHYGCKPTSVHETTNYFCSIADVAGNWEYGMGNFTHTFKRDGPFVIGYRGWSWIKLDNGKGNGGWNISTTVDLRTRSDTAYINHSPVSQSKPLYKVHYNTSNTIHLPIVDADHDTVRCRWAVGTECISICMALPGATLDEETCTIDFDTTPGKGYTKKGIYAVALTMEDFPKSPMTLNGVKKTPLDALSSVALQFLVQLAEESDATTPRFVAPTPVENQAFLVEEGDLFTTDLYTDNRGDPAAKANIVFLGGPIFMLKSATNLTSTSKHSTSSSSSTPPGGTDTTYETSLSWQTTAEDLGEHIVCANVQNSIGIDGEQRCFKVQVVPKGCKPLPCHNDGACSGKKGGGGFTCTCRPGFTGTLCEIDIDECAHNTCDPGIVCKDGINQYTCLDFCKSSPCVHSTGCKVVKTSYVCACKDGYTGKNCDEAPTTPTTTTTTTTITTTTPTTTTTTTTKTAARRTPVQTRSKSQSTDNCFQKYGDCHCVMTQSGRGGGGGGGDGGAGLAGFSRVARDALCLGLGFPIGLILSTVSYFWFVSCCKRFTSKKHQPTSKPDYLRPTATSPSYEVGTSSSTPDTSPMNARNVHIENDEIKRRIMVVEEL